MAKPHTSLRALFKHVKQVKGIEIRKSHRHTKIVDREGRVIGVVPSSPGDYRGLRNAVAAMRRNGLDLERHTYKPVRRTDGEEDQGSRGQSV